MATADSLGKKWMMTKTKYKITRSDLMSVLPNFIVPFGVVFLVFVVCHIIASKKQKMRLESLPTE